MSPSDNSSEYLVFPFPILTIFYYTYTAVLLENIAHKIWPSLVNLKKEFQKQIHKKRAQRISAKNGRRQLTTILIREQQQKNLTGLRSQCKVFFWWIYFLEKHARLDWWHFFEYFLWFFSTLFISFVVVFFLFIIKSAMKNAIEKFFSTTRVPFMCLLKLLAFHAVEGTKSFVNMLWDYHKKERSSHNQSTDWFLIRFLRNFIIILLLIASFFYCVS